MTDHTTQGTAGLTEDRAEFEAAFLKARGLRKDEFIFQRADGDPDRYWNEIIHRTWEGWQLASAKPAPVAEPVAHVIEERSTQYISAEDAMQSGLGYSAGSFPVVNLSIAMLPGKRTPPTGTTFYLRPPAPELAVADEGRLEELLDALWRAAWDRYPGARTDAANAIRAYFKTRSPVQEGAQGVEPYAYAVEDVKFKQPPTLVFADRIGDYSIILSQPDRYKATPLYVAPSQAIPEELDGKGIPNDGITIRDPNLEPNNIVFTCGTNKEVLKLTPEGMYYNGQFVQDAGEAHRAFLDVMKAMKK